METDSRRDQARNLLLMMAGVVVVIAGLRAAGQIILPVVFAVFVSIVVSPAVRWLVKVGVPRVVAVLGVMLVVSGALVGGAISLGDSVARFTVVLPTYQEPLMALVEDGLLRLEKLGLQQPPVAMDLIDPSAVFNLVGSTLGALVNLASRLVLILLYTSFILLELVQLEEKFKVAFAGNVQVSNTLVEGAASVQRYLAIKTGASAVTGLLAGAVTFAVGLDFFVLWGVLAFALNYIPTVGSVVAAIPVVVLALLQLGLGWAIGLGVFYIALNFAIGNVIEPRILGRHLGLSPFVVIVSLFFWGWMWGPAGMLLSVPMTVVIKLLLELSSDTRWLAILLGGVREAAQLSEAPQDGDPADGP